VIGRTDLLYCGANLFEAIVGIHVPSDNNDNGRSRGRPGAALGCPGTPFLGQVLVTISMDRATYRITPSLA
jgi:hypothetical protein